MKHFILATMGVVVVVILIVIGIIEYSKVSRTTASQQPAVEFPIPPGSTSASLSPAIVTKNFYTWYINAVITDPTFPTRDELETSMSQWITPEFEANWQSTAQDTDADPVLLVQTAPASWVTNITTATLTQSPQSSTVLVTLGDSSNSNQVIATLVAVNNQWLISQVVSATPSQ